MDSGARVDDGCEELSLRDLLDDLDLGLELVGLSYSTDETIRWAHVSELVDPTPWLLGGEFLLTTGINLPVAASDCLDYCRRLAAANIVALGMSCGAMLPHASMPDVLLEAASAAHLTLVRVPEHTLLQAIVRKVSDLLHRQVDHVTRDALDRVRRLNEVAAGPDGIARVMAELATNSHFRAVIYDEWLRPIATTDDDAPGHFADLRENLNSRLSKGMRWSIAIDEDDQSALALPLGLQGRLRGIFIIGKKLQFALGDRATVGVLVSLLSMLLELRYAASSPQRLRRSRAMSSILDSDVPVETLAADLERAGVSAEQFAVLLVDKRADHEALPALSAVLADRADDLLIRDTDAHGVAVLCGPYDGADIATAVRAANIGPAGFSDIVNLNGLRMALRQAEFALALATSQATDFVNFPGIRSYQTLLSLGDVSTRRSFADAVLGAIDDADPDGKQNLLATLGAFLSCMGRIEQTADRTGAHRHTVRSRLERIAEITGRDLSSGLDLFEMWLALEIRSLHRDSDESLSTQ